MSEQKIQQLLALAVKSVKTGDKTKGRQAFLAAIKLDPENETAWMGLVSVAKDNRERLTALKQVLIRNPDNARALAILQKLGIPPERLIGEAPVREPDPEPEPDSYDYEDDDFDARFESFESASFSDDQPTSVESAFTTETMTRPPDPEPEAIAQSSLPQSVFELPPPMLGTEVGVPVANPQKLGQVTQDVEELVNNYLASEHKFDNINWVRKTKRRAGEADIWKWRAQVLGVIVGILLVFVVMPALIFVSTPEGQKVVFAPTSTLTPTFTFTPTNTPGITPTPSSIPNATFTPTPTFQLQGVKATLDLTNTPVPTDVYNPASIVVGSKILEAWDLIRNEAYVEAFEILEEEKLAYDAGYPYPYYLQAQIDLLANEDPVAARGKLEDGEAQLVNVPSDVAENFYPMYNLGHGEVLFYEARQAEAEGRTSDANRLYDEAEERFLIAIDLDGSEIIEAYIQLARLYVAQEEYEQAIATLNIPIEGEFSSEYFTDSYLRIERGHVYFIQGIYDRALQAANEVLFYDPRSEEAYILQAESALALGLPGLANNYLDTYQLIYEDSLLAYKLEGDAYRMEGKPDQALLAYNIALQDNEDKPEYRIVLEARSDLYFEQRRFDLAEESYTLYLEDRDEDSIRLKRMLSAYQTQDYDAVLSDIRRLEDSNVVSNGDLALLRGQVLVDTAENSSDYNNAFQALSQAVLTLGVSDESRATADEYLARTNLELGNFEQALLDINRSLAPPFGSETGTRRFLKGQILQALEEYESAREEYEYIIAWSTIFPYDFIDEAQERYDEVLDLIANPPEEDDA